ncbi:transcriptional regulator [Actibacterium atlanticum]|uniref:Nif-specific regulatory protein n=1 Tax=Actibacterium atlanticum TaxID=1461693 RepID=A0A058ZMV0_9RHOB|nr:sigma 54-interacting transcriptional regulator [Actibacterium atlanticum]KCV82126.1 transcriptional regulator [Actibacterium atlanticum]
MTPETLLPDSLLHALPEAAVVLDTSVDQILAWNPPAAELLGAQASSTPIHFSQFVRNDLPNFVVFASEVDHRGEGWTRDIRLTKRDGTPLKCEIRARQIAGHQNCLLLLISDLRDLEKRAEITAAAEIFRAGLADWKRTEAFFAELERQNQLILNAAGEGIYGVNAEGKTTFVNRAAQEMLGWTSEDLLGHDIHSKIHHQRLNGEKYHSHDCPIYRSFRFEQVHRIEDEVFWRKDGKPIQVEYVSTPIYDQQVLAGAVVIFRDITERKEGERKLREAMDEVAELRDRLEQENAYLQEAITSERAHHDIIGNSLPTRQLLTKIDLVGPTDATVLISGEAGTGKALIATAIHKASARSQRPLIHFNCGSVAPDALEAELFGQVRGGYQNALRDKPGKLELAHGGTLFLDDIEELPLEVQGRLLDALRSRTVTRLGDTRARDIDLRVIAATSKDLERAVAAARLREDLYLTLNVFPITCHPLRSRKEDIPELTLHLLAMACKRLNRPLPIVTEGVIQRLSSYDWPGNVRELGNVIERGIIVSNGGKLIVELGDGKTPEQTGISHAKTEHEMQAEIRANLLNCLKEADGKVAGPGGAAQLLGVPAPTFYSRLKRYGLSKTEFSP